MLYYQLLHWVNHFIMLNSKEKAESQMMGNSAFTIYFYDFIAAF